jgi:hypothetical protein
MSVRFIREKARGGIVYSCPRGPRRQSATECYGVKYGVLGNVAQCRRVSEKRAWLR